MKKRNILIFPAGTEIGLEIFNALQYCKEVTVFGAGQDVSNHARFIYDNYHVIPSIYENNWLEELIKLCNDLEIDYIFPAYDDIILALSKYQNDIPATIISSPLKTCQLTRSKRDTYAYFKKIIRVPKVYNTLDQIDRFPVIVKPNIGQGSFGVRKIINKLELEQTLNTTPDLVTCEYLPGEEYTIDCFSDREQGLLFCGARVRNRMRNGIAVNTVTMHLPEAEIIARKINNNLELYGAWFFQLKRDNDENLALLEIAPRISGSMAAHRVQGVNFPLLSIFELERLSVSIMTSYQNIELDRALYNRYKHKINYSVLYIDLDDTIILNNKINIKAISLIFKLINDNKKIILITRHQGDLINTLTQYKITNLFDEIIHITNNDKKSCYIKESSAIFVDDSFSERKDVFDKCKIPTFDCSMIEILCH